MPAGTKLRELRRQLGLSLKAVEERTGVSRETVRRIEKGEEPPSLQWHLSQIASGLGVSLQSLLEGNDPKSDFGWCCRRATPAERLSWALLSVAERLQILVGFLSERYPQFLEPVGLAAVTGIAEGDLRRYLQGWQWQHPDRTMTLALARGLARLGYVDPIWVATGFTAEERGLEGLCEGLSALAVRAARVGQCAMRMRTLLESLKASAKRGLG